MDSFQYLFNILIIYFSHFNQYLILYNLKVKKIKVDNLFKKVLPFFFIHLG